ncbi:MAG: cytochrome [Deltaproteobacteria bacterium]|nr:cytochrome [Deltaproteobacteria bacterium]
MKPEHHVVSELEQRLDVAHHLPSLRRIWIGVAVAALGVTVVWPMSAPTRRGGVSSGAISNHHRLIEAQCEQCHAPAFGSVPDPKCAACHSVGQHAVSSVAGHQELDARCTSCHKEHHGEETLIPSDSPLCTNCHSHIDRIAPGSLQPGISDFEHHPEFAVLAWSGDPPQLKKVRLDDPDVRDRTHLKFSHDGHLSQLAADGKPVLACSSCHQPTTDGNSMQPISYARQCERCHHIEFDGRLEGTFVPHGDAAGVKGFVTAQLAKLHIETLHDGDRSETRDLVAKESLDAEIGLFTPGGACFKCHDVEEVTPASNASRFKVLSLDRQARLMPAAVFRHPTHRLVECESCHAGVRKSTSASDILLPRIARCRECHADSGTPAMVDSPCLECHRYHAAK